MAKIKRLTKEEYVKKLAEQDGYLGAGDEYLDDTSDGYYEDGGDYEEDGGEYEDDGYYGDGEAYEDGEYYDDGYEESDGYYEEEAYDEEAYDESGEYYDEEAYDGDEYYEDGEYYEEEAYEEDDDGDLEYLDEEEFYDENGRSVSDPLYGKKEEKPQPVYEEIPLPRRNSRTSTGYSRSRQSDDYQVKQGGKKKKRSIGAKIWGVVWRVLVFLLVTIVMLAVFLYGAVKLILLGPSSAMSTQYVSTFHETSALKWLPGLFMSDEEVEAILAKNMMPEAEVGTVSDKDLIVIDETPKEDVEPIVVEEIFGATYHGYMMIVQDPSTVYLGVIDQFAQSSGWIVPAFAEKYGAIGGVNGGEFVDMGSYSYTAMPVGGVISQGQGLFENNAAGAWNLVCMTNDNKLLLLKGYSVKAALDMGVRDGCHVRHETGPFLIIDGESLEVPDTEVYGGGKNPRTAIGQRSDGVMLLCVIDGRQASSLGATFKDMIDIMKEYGAVNAACLDGGTSSQMYYNGEIINNPYSPTGPRRCPTAWLVGGGNTNG